MRPSFSRLHRRFFLLNLCIALALGRSSFCESITENPDAHHATDRITTQSLVYGNPEGIELRVEFARPLNENEIVPVVLCFHGGGWQQGNRFSHIGTIRWLAKNGYAGASVQYRLTPKSKWPAQIEDARNAVRYLRKNADKLGIDPGKVVAMGDSAGGHLALLLGLMEPNDLDEGESVKSEPSCKVQAVINIFGPTSFTQFRSNPAIDPMIRNIYKNEKGMDGLIEDFLGSSDRNAPIMKVVSPVTYVNAGDPPILTFHGTNDQLVFVEQAKILHDALRKAGVTERLRIIEGGAHVWAGKFREISDSETLEFLNGLFKNPAN